ncbi:MAG: hypothetical protein AB7F65_10095 [Dehalococcoidia bacterium]
MQRFRSMALLFAAAVLSVAMIACSDDSDAEDGGAGEENSPTATAPAETGTPTTATPTTGTQTGTPGNADSPVSSDGTPTASPAPAEEDFERVEELAPIESAEVRFLESFPVQYRLDIVSGLPSGCARFVGAEVEREGAVFTVTVTNSMPAPGEEVACTMIYGYHESTVDLGTGLESGTEYTVNVNDKTITFVAQ